MLNRVMSLTMKLQKIRVLKLGQPGEDAMQRRWRICGKKLPVLTIFIIFLASRKLPEPVSYFQGSMSI
ncbi:hypothetical protein Peur_036615 [Populus x canadensis]